jgi:hypothetical protein
MTYFSLGSVGTEDKNTNFISSLVEDMLICDKGAHVVSVLQIRNCKALFVILIDNKLKIYQVARNHRERCLQHLFYYCMMSHHM